MDNEKKKSRSSAEIITLDRALELLNLHKKAKIKAGSPIVSVVRNPENPDHILSISLIERDVAF